MNPWEAIMQHGVPSPEDIQADQGSIQDQSKNVNSWAGVPDQNQVDPSGAPSIRGKTMRFEGHWERLPSGNYHFVKDKVWYEDSNWGT